MRIGLVGYGLGGRFFHAPLIASTAGARLVGVVTRSPQRRAEVAQDHPGVACHDDLASLVAAGIDALVISAPVAERKALVLEAIQHGIPVVSDKPFALNFQDAQDMVQAAERAGVALTVYQNRRWDSDVLTVAKLLREGTLGPVRIFESRIQVDEPHKAGATSGGGLLRDLGSHLVDQALTLFGPVTQVYAEVLFHQGDPERDDEFFISLQHQGGVISHLSGSCLQGCPWRLRVVGEEGVYTVEGLDGQTQALLQGLSPRSEKGNWGAEEHQRWGWLSRGEERERIPSERGRWDLFYARWLATLTQGSAPPVSTREALACQVVLDAARQSALDGQAVKVASVPSRPDAQAFEQAS
ncbi:Gfo/Idh/MocA family protein [Pseudomonas sp. HUK17]|uniref:Gfo/Idh/MocA family protein n=1 Tax=Pseudomonas sp. HUK17 TaxID=1799359 RepID=UPI00079BF488|nr:Gfo/Idh/MocA family oxidoreductase [Pseudomonas sp. HUK17]KXJ30691.1 oxidoreductase [Pseudomonas sp. HUK17]